MRRAVLAYAAIGSLLGIVVGCSDDSAEKCSRNDECQAGEVCNLATGQCEPCEQQCEGKCCGDNGCGGTCRDECAGPGQICEPATCTCESCVPQCEGKCCGDDGCGGSCADSCEGLALVCDPESCTCEPCIPLCDGKCCGDDGCGGTCQDDCVGFGQVCDLGTCTCAPCMPQCDGRCCGDDGCGGTCQNGCVGPEQVCDPGSCACEPCVPQCAGKCCGDDGCGGTCTDTCSGPQQACALGTCTCEPCVPQCEGKCCGDDGCGGICSDTCSSSLEVCVPSTCACMPPGELGDPCPDGGLHPDSPNCAEGLVCHAVPADGRIYECPSGSVDECWYTESDVNPVCIDGHCGMAFCTIPATRICGCPYGYHSYFPWYESIDGEEVVCFPGYADYGGDCCAWADINPCFYPFCASGDCMGLFADGKFGTCTTFLDCALIPPVFDRDCVNGLCGMSLCALDTQPDGTCPEQYGKQFRVFESPLGPRCIRAVSPAGVGEPCILGDVNSLWGDCAAGLTCVGVPADGTYGACPGGIPDCLLVPVSWNPSCSFVTSQCGGSFCAEECDGNGDCAVGYTPMIIGTTCYCAPSTG